MRGGQTDVNRSISQRVPSGRSGDQYIDFARAFRTVIASKLLILGTALVVFAIGCGYALFARPVYQANVLIKVDVGDASVKGLPASLSGIFDLKTASTAELEMLRSRSVVTRAVDNARLYIVAQPVYLPVVGAGIARRSDRLSEPGLFGYGGFVWGNESLDIRRFDLPASLEGKAFRMTITGPGVFTLHQGDAFVLKGQIGIDTAMASPQGPVEIRVDAINARPGAQFLVTRISKEDAVEDLQKKLVIGERGKQSGIISVGLDGPDPRLISNVLNEIANQYIQQNINLKTEEAERSLAFLETQLPDLQAAIEAAEAKYSAFRNARGTVDIGEEVKAILQQSVQAQLRLAELRQKRDELSTRFQSENPIVEGVNQQIRTVTAEIATVNDRIRKIPGTEQDLVRLTRDVRVNTELYSSLQNTAHQLKLVRASRIGSAKLIDGAVQPSTPVKPNKKLIVAASAALGLALGLAAAFLRKAVVGELGAPEELTNLVGFAPHAAIQQSHLQAKLHARLVRNPARKSVLAEEDSDDPAIESLRSLMASIDNAMKGATSNVTTFVGPTEGLGKSFIALNLCALMARSGKRVLLIDADLRGGYLHRHFAADRSSGLTEWLAGQARMEDVIKPNVLNGLDLVSTGVLQARPADALANSSLKHLLAEASKRYDLVVIDTAPALAMADALIVARHSGHIFCVARKGRSTAEQILETARRFEQSGHPITGFVFNGAKPVKSNYGYGPGYRTQRRKEATA